MVFGKDEFQAIKIDRKLKWEAVKGSQGTFVPRILRKLLRKNKLHPLKTEINARFWIVRDIFYLGYFFISVIESLHAK